MRSRHALLKRFGSSITERNVAATMRPTPGVVAQSRTRIPFRQQLEFVVHVSQALLDDLEHGAEGCDEDARLLVELGRCD
jgi:hypothetical protein